MNSSGVVGGGGLFFVLLSLNKNSEDPLHGHLLWNLPNIYVNHCIKIYLSGNKSNDNRIQIKNLYRRIWQSPNVEFET